VAINYRCGELVDIETTEGRNHLPIEAVAVELDGVGRESLAAQLGEPKLPQHTNLREGCDFVVCSRVCAIAQRLLEGLFSGVAGSSTGLQAYFNGRVNWAIQGLEQIVYELRDRLAELEEAARAVNTRTVAGHAVWSSYHEVTCRYRRLEADIIRQILTELDLQRRRALEEAVVDVDEIFDAVCPQCREPRSVEPESVA
jgi:hypothetical protein